MTATRLLLLYIDEEERDPDEVAPLLRNVRLVEPTTGREVGRSELGAWSGVAPAIAEAAQSAVRRGSL